ncbi:hypothetical protein FOZ63_006903, partial [Perkinsus olseni]
MRRRAEIVKEGDRIVNGLGGEAPRLDWGEFPSKGGSSFAQDIACLSSIRQAVERHRTTQRTPDVVQNDTVGAMQLSAALKRLGAAKLARGVELEDCHFIPGQPGPPADAPLEQFREDVRSLRDLDLMGQHGNDFVRGSELAFQRAPDDEHPDEPSDAEVIEHSPKESIPEQLSDCALGNEESRRSERAEVIVASPVVRKSRAECVKEDMVRRIAEKISKVEATGQKNDEDDNVLSEYLQSTPLGRASCYGTERNIENGESRASPGFEANHDNDGRESLRECQPETDAGEVAEWGMDQWERQGGSSAGKEMMRTENLVDYLPPLTDVSSTPSTLPMNLTMKTTASEELDRLADLRGKLALEAHREEEKRKKEEAGRLAVGRRAMMQVAANEERETVRKKVLRKNSEENSELPSPVRRAKKRLAKSLKMEAKRKQREEEEKRKTQAEIFRKRDER